jgi:5-methylcytosine-specific restriction enzyme subunit McrC
MPYGLGIGDFYQLFAYGHRFLDAAGDVFLVFPASPEFNEPLPVFEYSEHLRLWAVPFDLERGSVPQILEEIVTRKQASAA